MGLYNTLVRRRRCHPPPIHDFSFQDAGGSSTTVANSSYEMHLMSKTSSISTDVTGLSTATPSEIGPASSDSVYSHFNFMRRNKKREIAAESARKKRKSKHLKDFLPDRDATIGALTLTFTAVRDIGDATNIGYMKGLAGLALLIIETTEGVRTCKSEVQRLTRHIVELVHALINEVSANSATAKKPTEKTLYEIEALQTKLQYIHRKLQKMKQGSYLSRLLRQAEDNAEIVRLNNDIKHSLRVFGIQQHLTIHSNLAKSESSQKDHRNSVIQIIETTHESQMRNIRRTLSEECIDGEAGNLSLAASTLQITDCPISEEPEDLDGDVTMDVDVEGTIHEGDTSGFRHSLPERPKSHYGHEVWIEQIVQLLIRHQDEEADPLASGSVTPRPTTPVPGSTTAGGVASRPFSASDPSSFGTTFSVQSLGGSGGSNAPLNPYNLPNIPGRSDTLSTHASLPITPSRTNPFITPPLTPKSPASFAIPSLPSTPDKKGFTYLPSVPNSPLTSSSQFPYLPSAPSTPSVKSFAYQSSAAASPSPSSRSLSQFSSNSSLSPFYTPGSPAPNTFFPSPSVSPSASSTSFLTPSTSKQPRSQGPAKLALLGDPGIGKSSIAKRIIHHPYINDLYGNRRIWVSCEKATDVGGVLHELVSVIGVEQNATADDIKSQLINILNPSPKSPTSPSSTLSSASSSYSFTFTDDSSFRSSPSLLPTLLVLDGLDQAWLPHSVRSGTEDLLSLLSSLPNLAIIVTLRGNERPYGVRWTRPFLSPVSSVSIEDGVEIFASISDMEGDCVKDIVDMCGGNPSLIKEAGQKAPFEGLEALLSRLRRSTSLGLPTPPIVNINSVGSFHLRPDLNRL